MAILRAIWMAFVFVWLLAPQLAAETRVALVIGNSAYNHTTPLANPINDARAIAAKLTAIGFDVTLAEDLDGTEFRVALGAFSEKSLNADLVLFYYAGHAIEMNSVNYLIPIDAKMQSESTAQFEAVSLDQVLGAVRAAGKLGLVMLDACRNNPFATTMKRTDATRGVSRGLAPISVEGETGMLISFAAEAGKTADDGETEHSPYTAALLEVLDQPGLEVGRMFRTVRARVKETTGGVQVPVEQAQLPDQDIFLVAGATAVPTASAVATTTDAAPVVAGTGTPTPVDDPLLIYLAALQSGNRAEMESFIRRYPDHERAVDARAVVADMAETDFWADISTKNTAAGYRAYLLGFPQGRYRADAETRIAALNPEPEPAVKPAAKPAVKPSKPAKAILAACPFQTGDWAVQNVASDDTLFVRSGPGTASPQVGELAYNASGITLIGCEGKWCQIEYGCLSGYASGKYLTDQDPGTEQSEFSGIYTVADHPADQLLNIRSGPSTDYDVVGELPHDASGVIVTDCQSKEGYDFRWCNLSWKNVSGWGYGRYLQNDQGQNPKPTAPIAAVAAVPAEGDQCFELWFERNAIYAAKGYCFSSELGLDTFGNDGCTTTDPDLSAIEKLQVDAIKVQEAEKGC